LGLIVDRDQLCAALGISDSTIGAWEKKGMPVVRKGRGRGMKSLYSLDAVRAWCDSTGYGHSIQALLANFSRSEPAPAPAPVQRSAPPPKAALDPDDADALKVYPALEIGFISLPTILAGEGLSSATVVRVLDAFFDAMRAELVARHAPATFIARELDTLRAMVDEERESPGSWRRA